MTTELIVFCGLQASGKTTFYRERFAASHQHVSKDAWPNARNREARQRRLIDEHLRAGRSVVVDNTNPTPAEREPLIAIAHAAGARAVSYAFLAVVDEAVRRNALRTGRARVPDAGIYAVAKRLCPVLASEGFDRRFVVQLADRGFRVTEVLPEEVHPPVCATQPPGGGATSW
jgi:predicted kinase